MSFWDLYLCLPSCYECAWIIRCAKWIWLYMGPGDLNSSLYTFMASALPIEPPLQPLKLLIMGNGGSLLVIGKWYGLRLDMVVHV